MSCVQEPTNSHHLLPIIEALTTSSMAHQRRQRLPGPLLARVKAGRVGASLGLGSHAAVVNLGERDRHAHLQLHTHANQIFLVNIFMEDDE